jgi:flagellar M-ring protein FliF
VIVVLLIIVSVLKPLAKGLLTQAKQSPLLVGGGPGTVVNVGAGAAGEATGLAYEQQVAQARGLVSQDPKRVAQVVKTWVSSDG